MSQLTLKDLEEAFKQLWLNTSQLPTLLDKWQEMVSQYLKEIEPSESELELIEKQMDHWNQVLVENRMLIEEHQKTLKQEIGSGDENSRSQTQAESYLKN